MPWKKPFARACLRSRGIFPLAAALLLVLPVSAQKPSAELPKDLLDLVRIKQKMAQNLTHLPDFTCIETTQRSRRPSSAVDFALVDSLKLEVLFTGDHELYSWQGSRKFEELDPRAVGGGMFSNGEFGVHAKSVFVNSNAQTHFANTVDWRGRDALQYNFRIPALVSGWIMNMGAVSGVVGELGTFWADPKTFEVLRLEISADEIPPNLPVQGARLGIEYGRVRIGESDIVAPQQAELVLTHTDGTQSRNLVEFSQCRQYHAESAIRFEDAAETAANVTTIQEVELPADLPLKLQLDTAIDSDTAAQGDLLTAHLTAPAEIKGKVYVPQGSLVRGRIRRLERFNGDKPYLVVGLEFSEIEFGNKRAAFLGHLDQTDAIRGRLATSLPKEKEMPPEMRSLNMADGNWKSSATIRIIDLSELELPGVGTFAVEGRRVQLAAGFHMTWRTVSLAPAVPAGKKR
jgi:hypothetical protein